MQKYALAALPATLHFLFLGQRTGRDKILRRVPFISPQQQAVQGGMCSLCRVS